MCCGGCLNALIRYPRLKKIVVTIWLLLLDADVFFTFVSFQPYVDEGFFLAPALISLFTMFYLFAIFLADRVKFTRRLTLNIECGMYHFPDGKVISIEDVGRAQTEEGFKEFMVANGLEEQFYQDRNNFIRHQVTWKHSVPFLRTTWFACTADIRALDVAGILNADALYSFTTRMSQLGMSLYFTMAINPQQGAMIIWASLVISITSFYLTILNIAVSFPKVLNQLELDAANEEQRKKAFENTVMPCDPILGMRKACDAEVASVSGLDKPDAIQEIMQKWADKERKFLDDMKAIAAMETGQVREGNTVGEAGHA